MMKRKRQAKIIPFEAPEREYAMKAYAPDGMVTHCPRRFHSLQAAVTDLVSNLDFEKAEELDLSFTIYRVRN